MLKFTIPATEDWDELKQEFIYSEEVTLELEHSLVSLSKWESIWEKPFLGNEDKTPEETLSYIYCMTLTPDVSPEMFQRLTNDHVKQINNYIDAKMSATWFNEKAIPGQPRKSTKVITSELIYYWMGSNNIWIECQHWHLNRLFTLLKVHNAEAANAGKKPKTSQREMLARRAELNAQRRAQLNTSG